MPANPNSVFQQVREITGWTDAQIGLLVNLSPATVEAYRLGYRTEYVDGGQMNAIRAALNLYRDHTVANVERFLLLN